MQTDRLTLLALAISGGIFAALISSGVLTLGTWFVLLVVASNAFAVLDPFGLMGGEDHWLDRVVQANFSLLLPIALPTFTAVGYLYAAVTGDMGDDDGDA